MPASPPLSAAVRVSGLVAAAAGGCVFLGIAAVRALNFDESLALHAGWLLWSGEAARPALLMPWTALLGAWTHLVPDPAATLLGARLLVTGAVLGALLVFARAAGRGAAEAAWIVALSLGSAAFVSSGLELRYDGALLLTLLLGAAAALRGSAPVALGLAAAALAAHGVKGLSLGGLVLLAGLLHTPAAGRPRLLAAAAAGFGLWIAGVALAGRGPALLDDLRLFAALGGGTPRVARIDALGDSAWPDLPLWLGFVAALGAALLREARRPPPPTAAGGRVLVAAALIAVSPLLTHPHPWPYMLALPVPFAAALVVRALGDLAPARPALAVGLALGAGVLSLVTAPFEAHRRGLGSSRAALEADLALLHDLARPGDRAFDPAGLAWFLPPCTEEWYVDTLFAPGVAEGTWMAEAPSPERCAWVVWSARTAFLPEARQRALTTGWRPFQGALILAPGDERWSARPQPPRPPQPVENYW